jgi:prepilin-type N-terminal cleavage/methylation domain-containing protein
MKMPSRSGVRAFSLVEMLVVIVIMAVLAAALFPRIAGHGRTTAGKATTPMAKAHDTECMMNIRSARQGIDTLKAGDPDGHPVQSLDELKLPKELTHCAVSKEAYQYDPGTGLIRCPFPAHSSY